MRSIYSDAVHEIKPWLLQLILQKVFRLTLEFRPQHVSKRTVSEITLLLNSRLNQNIGSLLMKTPGTLPPEK
jgi:hypothetical protein